MKQYTTPTEAKVLIGKRLKHARINFVHSDPLRKYGLTQTELANAIGVTFQQIQKYEKGTNAIPFYNLWRLSLILKKPIDYFSQDLTITKERYKHEDISTVRWSNSVTI